MIAAICETKRGNCTMYRTPLVTIASILLVAAGAFAQAPATQPTTRPSPATQPNGNGAQGIIRADGGIILNFKDASIDAVLEQLSEVAGFIVVKETNPEGKVTLLSKQPIKRDEILPVLNTVLRNAGSGYAAIQQARLLQIKVRNKTKRTAHPVTNANETLKLKPS